MYKFGDGDKAVPWFDTIKEEPVRDLMRAKGYKNPAEVAMAYHNANKLLNQSGDVVSLPKADAPKEAWDKFYTAMGRPASADKYEFKPADGVTHDAATVKFGQELFYELGIPADKAGAAVQKWDAFVAQQTAAATASAVEQGRVANAKALADLDIEWGGELDKNKAAGERVMKSLGLDDATMASIEKQIGAAPVVKLLAMLGRKSDEGGYLGGGNKSDPNDPTGWPTAQVQERIDQLRGDAAFQAKYNDPKHAENKAAVQTMLRLHAAATGPARK